jgi:hypothetical protein
VTQRTVNTLRRASLGGGIQQAMTFSGDGVMTFNPVLPPVLTPQTQSIVLDGTRDGGGMQIGQGFGWWAKGTDSLGFRQDMARADGVWVDPNPAAPVSEQRFHVVHNFSWFTPYEIFWDHAQVHGQLGVDSDVTQTSGLGVPVVGAAVNVDMTAAAGTTFVIVPARPGFGFVPIRVSCIITAVAGFVSQPTMSIGVNAAHDNFNGALNFPSAAQAALGVNAEVVTSSATTAKLLAPNTAVLGIMNVAGVAGTLRASFYYTGVWVPM